MSTNANSLAMQRIAEFVDENSFMEIGSQITARSTDFNLTAAKSASDGVVTGYGLVNSNLVFIYSQDASVLNGTIGEMHAKKIANIYDMAMKMGAPVVGFIDCGGVRLQESIDALDGFGTIYAKEVEASGVIPQISVVFGNCGGGLSVVPALSDFAFIEEAKGRMFVNSPDAIVGNKVEICDTAAASFQAEENGCIDFAGSKEEIFEQIRTLISILPTNNEGDVYSEDGCQDDLNRVCNAIDVMAQNPHYVLAEISDDHLFVETKRAYAPNMVTGFIKLNGMTVGAVANCAITYDEEGKVSKKYPKTLTARACNKAAEFVSFCDAFSIPVLTITNVTGLSTNMCSEKNLAKAMARMTSAFAGADVPKVNLITEEAYGSAYVAMNSKSVGADLVYAFTNAKIGMMDSDMAAKLMYPAASAEELKEKASEYTTLCANASAAAARGYVDLCIEPLDARKYLVAAFEMLYTKCSNCIEKKHSTK